MSGRDSAPDREMLLAQLSGARRHVLNQLQGLDEEALHRPVLPSGWSPLALVRHLTLSDERYWFEVIVAGGPMDFWPEGDNADWQVSADEPSEEIVAAYRAAIEASDAIIGARCLADPPATVEPWWEEAGMSFPDLRQVIGHVLVETATHAGQLDAVRELIDGKQYIVL